MTTAVKSPHIRGTLAFPMPIYSVDDGKVYLVMEHGTTGFLIRKSAWARRKLGPYWKVWVRDLLLKLDDKYVKQITISSKGVWFVTDRSVDEWFWAASHLLANVVQLAEPPMNTRGDDHEGYWKVHRHADLTPIIDAVVLPDGASRFFTLVGGCGYVILRRRGVGRKQCPFTIKDVRMMVELQVAQACTRDGVPLNWHEIWWDRHRARFADARAAAAARARESRCIVTVEPPSRRKRRRTIRGVPVERGDNT